MFDLRMNAVDLYSAACPPAVESPLVLCSKVRIDRFSAARKAAALERIKSVLLGIPAAC